MIYTILIPLMMGILAGYAGGSLPFSSMLDKKGDLDKNGRDIGGVMPINLSNLPELLMGLIVILALVPVFGWYSILAGCWFYAWFQSGTWLMLPWWKEGVRDPERGGKIRPVSEWVAKKFGYEFDSEGHAWIFAAIRGFLITMPFGCLGLITSPLSREVGSHFQNHAIAECLEGFTFGLCLVLFLILI